MTSVRQGGGDERVQEKDELDEGGKLKHKETGQETQPGQVPRQKHTTVADLRAAVDGVRTPRRVCRRHLPTPTPEGGRRHAVLPPLRKTVWCATARSPPQVRQERATEDRRGIAVAQRTEETTGTVEGTRPYVTTVRREGKIRK